MVGNCGGLGWGGAAFMREKQYLRHPRMCKLSFHMICTLLAGLYMVVICSNTSKSDRPVVHPQCGEDTLYRVAKL